MKNYKKFIKKQFNNLDLLTSIVLYFTKPSLGDNYNKNVNNLEKDDFIAITIKGYVRELSPESLKWQEYGLERSGMKEIICDNKYKKYFQECNSILIKEQKYQTYSKGVGKNALIQEQGDVLIRVIIAKEE